MKYDFFCLVKQNDTNNKLYNVNIYIKYERLYELLVWSYA